MNDFLNRHIGGIVEEILSNISSIDLNELIAKVNSLWCWNPRVSRSQGSGNHQNQNGLADVEVGFDEHHVQLLTIWSSNLHGFLEVDILFLHFKFSFSYLLFNLVYIYVKMTKI